MDDSSDTVPEEARRSEEVDALRAKAEPVVWTDSMLQALIDGVKGGKWHSLLAKCLLRGSWAVFDGEGPGVTFAVPTVG